MDFRVTEDQQALVEGIRTFCEGRVPIETLRELEQKNAFDRSLWSELAEMGVFGLRLSEEDGGVGLGCSEAVLVFAELGRALVPGPLVWSHLAAGLVDGAASGETVVGGLDEAMGDGPVLIEHFASLDALLALRDDGVYRIDPRAVEASPVETPLDPLTPLHHATALPEGERIAGPDDATALRIVGTALVSGQLLGITEMTQLLAVEYAKKREQFDRPIGSFQALKHMLADMFVRQEVARAAAYAAGATLDDPEVGELWRAVAAAKIVCGESALKNAKVCIQVYGGMGYTWEMPCHYLLKRTWVLESLFGAVDEHADRIAGAVEQEAAEGSR